MSASGMGATRWLVSRVHSPGMMYVKLLSALSICDTCPAFLVMNSSYIASHCGGSDSTFPSVGRRGAFVACALGSADGGGIPTPRASNVAGHVSGSLQLYMND